MRNVKAVLFDLDGTLLNSIPGILESFHATLDHFVPGHGLSDADIVAMLGRPLSEQMLEIGGPELAGRMVEHYRQHNYQVIPTMELYDGALEALRELKGSGRAVGIVTSKQRRSTAMSLKKYRLDELLDVVVVSEDTTRHKPEPDPLLLALSKIGCAPENALYVGDATFDVLCAKAASTHSCAALWGPNPRETLLALEPTLALEDVREVPVRLNRGE